MRKELYESTGSVKLPQKFLPIAIPINVNVLYFYLHNLYL